MAVRDKRCVLSFPSTPSLSWRYPACLIHLNFGMKVSARFMQLPSSLLVAALALTVSALPVESTELLVLNPDNFDSTVAKGVW